ncbi:universal stress protein [Amphritea sp. 2_MG-2023]|uniref:universal stress protein n=1 Tax=Amphritea TaxID=515417 RepID=UPI001C07389C|nr:MULTISPECIES: universal stress protein [Amphritea]MBU2966747.1 universal stress protein [Amphritea atlantica]MDO6418986.1 universal stress protein [Amphritea sp. 2_MG-2023]
MSLTSIKTILCTTNLDDHTRPVLREAVNLALSFKAQLIMLHVMKPIGEIGHNIIINNFSKDKALSIYRHELSEIRDKMMKRSLDFFEEELGDDIDYSSLNMKQVVLDGDRVKNILRMAKKSDIVVMGSHSYFGYSSNTTRQVIKRSPCPVFVVPTKVS